MVLFLKAVPCLFVCARPIIDGIIYLMYHANSMEYSHLGGCPSRGQPDVQARSQSHLLRLASSQCLICKCTCAYIAMR